MYVIKLENTVTHQIHRFESEDMNNGSKLYYEFNVNTLELEDGEYILTLCDSEDNVLSEDILRIGDFTPQTLQYKAGGDTYIAIEFDAKLGPKEAQIEETIANVYPDGDYDGMTYVKVDATAVYENGKNEGVGIGYSSGYGQGMMIGVATGEQNQKAKLESITITENGTYTREDGYNVVQVEVPDLNGSYDEGYEQGYGDGYTQGETVSYESGYEDGYVAANEEVAETARVLDITENGLYYSEFSKEGEDFVFDIPITGDGDFLDYISLDGIGYNTNIIPTEYTRVECWVKPAETTKIDACIFGTQWAWTNGNFKIRWYNGYSFEWNGIQMKFDLEANVWHHIIVGKQDGVILDGKVLYEPWDNKWNASEAPIWINRVSNGDWGVNGDFGMFKIDDTVFIPYEGGYLNTTTNEPLESYIFDAGNAEYHKVEKPTFEGNLIRTVKVNVVPKINIAKEGIGLAFSTFKQVPECIDFTDITDCYFLFANCARLLTAPYFDTSKVTRMESMFQNTSSLKTVPLYDTSNVTNMYYMFGASSVEEIPPFDMSKVTTVERMCTNCNKLKTFPSVNTENVTNMNRWFYYCTDLESLPQFNAQNTTNLTYLFYANMTKLIEFGGFLNLKTNINDNYGFAKCPNLNYESCINILNGLYDFIGNGETPTSSQGKLKVHQNFLNLVGDEISIGTNKGWTITA